MPELPEVETIRWQLAEKINGKKIEKAEVKLQRMINVPAAEFEKAVTGSRVKDIRRRAKILVFDLSSGWSIVVHLKMSGQLIYDGGEGIGKPHIVYTFSDGNQLKHYDFRLFGYAKLVKTEEVEKIFIKEKLGPEVLDTKFVLTDFEKLLAAKPNSKIKPLLMDQTFIAGVGNIYAQEACFCAGVMPTRKVATLKKEEIKKIYNCLRKILILALEHGGSSIDAYVDAGGKKGSYVSLLKVYGREKERCLACGEKIKNMKLAGRGTNFCPVCQK